MMKIKNYHSVLINVFITIVFLLLSSFINNMEAGAEDKKQTDMFENNAITHIPKLMVKKNTKTGSYPISSWFIRNRMHAVQNNEGRIFS